MASGSIPAGPAFAFPDSGTGAPGQTTRGAAPCATVHVVVDTVVWQPGVGKSPGGVRRVWEEVLPRLLSLAPPHVRFTLLLRFDGAPALPFVDLAAWANARFRNTTVQHGSSSSATPAACAPRVTLRRVPPYPWNAPASSLEQDVRVGRVAQL